MTVVLGVDPDTTTVGWALTRDKVLVRAGLVSVPAKGKVAQRKLLVMRAFLDEMSRLRTGEIPEFQNVDRIVVEGQTYRPGSPVRAQDLIHLAQVGGFCAGALAAIYPLAELVMPTPMDWKSSVKKDIFTKRILADFDVVVTDRGICFKGSDCRVPGTQGLKPSKATHVLDAMGLARWGWRTASVRSRSAT
jgi:hypothetical protein